MRMKTFPVPAREPGPGLPGTGGPAPPGQAAGGGHSRGQPGRVGRNLHAPPLLRRRILEVTSHGIGFGRTSPHLPSRSLAPGWSPISQASLWDPYDHQDPRAQIIQSWGWGQGPARPFSGAGGIVISPAAGAGWRERPGSGLGGRPVPGRAPGPHFLGRNGGKNPRGRGSSSGPLLVGLCGEAVLLTGYLACGPHIERPVTARPPAGRAGDVGGYPLGKGRERNRSVSHFLLPSINHFSRPPEPVGGP